MVGRAEPEQVVFSIVVFGGARHAVTLTEYQGLMIAIEQKFIAQEREFAGGAQVFVDLSGVVCFFQILCLRTVVHVTIFW